MKIEQAFQALGPNLFLNQSTRKRSEANLSYCVSTLKGQDIGRLDLNQLVRSLDGKSPATINRYLSALKKLTDASKVIYIWPWQKEPRGRKRWLTKEERKQLLTTLQYYPDRVRGESAASFIRLLLALGCRKGELLGIDFNRDVRYDSALAVCYITLRGTKNGEDRIVCTSRSNFELLRQYCPWGYEQTGSECFERSFYDVWTWAKHRMGLAEDVDFVPHALRHTHATMRLEQGDTIIDLQDALGHRDIRSTRRYTHVTPSRKVETALRLEEAL